MREGTMFINSELERMDIQFKNGTTLGGLHCGDSFKVFLHCVWQDARIELKQFSKHWYLIHGDTGEILDIPLTGLLVRTV